MGCTRLSLIAVAVAVACAGACSQPSTQQPAAKAPSSDPPASSTAQAYYTALVQRVGGDYAACPAAVDAVAGACTDGQAAPAGPTRVLLMLDASGSMAARMGGSTKMQAARDALTAFVDRLDGDVQVALRVYGHTGNNTPAGKPESCRGTALVHPFAALDPARFRAAVGSFEPQGWTPIAAALQAAASDFPAGPGGNNVVYLVSDGEETCGGDPSAAARALRASGIAVTVNVIGFGVDAKAAAQLRPIAEAGGGEYLSANSAADLTRLFNERVRLAAKRFNCAVREQSNAFNTTVRTHSNRFNCLVREASNEFNAVVRDASRDFNQGAIDAATRRYAIDAARTKRDGIIDPAKAERDAAIDASRVSRDDAMSRERDLRDSRLDEAHRERR